MKELKRKDRPIRDIRGRLRGLLALMMAVMISIGMLPMQNVNAETGKNYYLVVGWGGDKLFWGSSDSSTSEQRSKLYSFMGTNEGGGYANDVLVFNRTAATVWTVKTGAFLTKEAEIGESYSTTLDIPSGASIYYGSVNNTSGYAVLYFEGTKVEEAQGFAYKSYELSGGKYKVAMDRTMENGYERDNMRISPLLTSITLSSTSLEFAVGDEAKTLKVDGDPSVSWNTSNNKVATVENGVVKPVGPGTCVITAVYDDDTSVTASCNVTVKGDDSAAGDKEITVKKDETAPETELEKPSDEIINSLLTDAEKNLVNSGQKLNMWVEMKNIDSSVPEADKKVTVETAQKAASGATVGMFFDVSFWKQIGSNDAVKIEKIPGGKLKLKIKVPAKLKAPAGKKRTFFVIKIHNGVGSIVGQGTGDEVPTETDEFSTYALAYADAPSGFYSGLKVKQSGGKLKISWDKAESAAKYGVFVTYCGNKYPSKPVKTTDKKSVTIKKIKGKSIDFNKSIKLYVAAYDSSGNLIGKTTAAHIVGYKKSGYTNPSSIKVSNKSVSVSVGGTAKIKATQKLEKSGKKTLSNDHVAKFRYRSTDESIATVSKDGSIKGVSAGSCDVYVYTKNALAAKVTVTVN